MNEDIISVDPSVLEGVRVRLVGVGGAGCNTIHRLTCNGLQNIATIAVNTDRQHLDMIRAHRKALLGKAVTKEWGCGGDPEKGRLAAEESLDEIARVIGESDIVFIAAGLGGGTGTGAAPLIAKVAKELGSTVVGVVTTPFKFEGGLRRKIALKGLEQMQGTCHTVVVIDNNRLLELYPQYGIKTAFTLADEVVYNMLLSITESISKPSLINIDYADFKTIVGKGKLASIGLGWSSSANRAEEATFNALQSPLLDIAYDGISGAIVHVTGGEDMRLSEASRPGEIVAELMGDDALVIWGARVDNYYASTMQISLILTGVDKPVQTITLPEPQPTADIQSATTPDAEKTHENTKNNVDEVSQLEQELDKLIAELGLSKNMVDQTY